MISSSIKKNRFVLLFLLLVLLIGSLNLTNCVSSYLGEETIIEKSAEVDPEWLLWNRKEKDGRVYFTLRQRIVYKQLDGIEIAKRKLRDNIIKDLKNRTLEKYIKKLRESDLTYATVLKNLNQIWIKVVDLIQLDSLKENDVYWQRVRITSASQIRLYFNIYLLMSISQTEYQVVDEALIRHLSQHEMKEIQSLVK